MKKIDWILIAVLFVSAMFLWSFPIRNSPLPFSETDGATHFAMSDYMYTTDKISDNFPYYRPNNFILHGPLLYPPTFFISQSISQVIVGDRFVSFFLFLVLINSAIIFSTYLLMKKLYGTTIAFFSSFMLLFSGIDIFTHLFGQWPALIALAAIPVALYCLYKYIQKKKSIYLYIIPFLILTTFTHPQFLAHLGLILIMYPIFIWIKEKKKPFEWKHIIFTGILTLVLLGPFLGRPIYYFFWASEGIDMSSEEYSLDSLYSPSTSVKIKGLFYFYSINVKEDAYPSDFFSYKKMFGWWSLPFLFIGIVFLLYRRDKKDLLLLSWFISLYIICHSDVLFGIPMLSGKIGRSIIDLPHLFFPIISIGFYSVGSFFKKFKYWKVVMVGIFVILVVSSTGVYAYNLLKNAYPPGGRIHQHEFDAGIWMKENTDYESHSWIFGVPSYTLIKWMESVAQRNILEQKNTESFANTYGENFSIDYIIIDYAYMTQEMHESMKDWEIQNSNNLMLVYDDGGIIRIYKITNNKDTSNNDCSNITKDAVIFYHADWCSHCNNMKPIVKELEAEGYNFIWVEVSGNNTEIIRCFSDVIQGSIPEFICAGTSEFRMGAMPKEKLRDFAEECRVK